MSAAQKPGTPEPKFNLKALADRLRVIDPRHNERWSPRSVTRTPCEPGSPRFFSTERTPGTIAAERLLARPLPMKPPGVIR